MNCSGACHMPCSVCCNHHPMFSTILSGDYCSPNITWEYYVPLLAWRHFFILENRYGTSLANFMHFSFAFLPSSNHGSVIACLSISVTFVNQATIVTLAASGFLPGCDLLCQWCLPQNAWVVIKHNSCGFWSSFSVAYHRRNAQEIFVIHCCPQCCI